MLVISREVGESIVIEQPPDRWILTVAEVSGDRVNLGITSRDGREPPDRKLPHAIELSENIKISIVDVRGDKVRLGIEAPKQTIVQRLEIYELIRRGDDDDGTSGVPATRRPPSHPPTLTVQMQAPRPDDDSDDRTRKSEKRGRS
jgi:carbon storage regulator